MVRLRNDDGGDDGDVMLRDDYDGDDKMMVTMRNIWNMMMMMLEDKMEDKMFEEYTLKCNESF